MREAAQSPELLADEPADPVTLEEAAARVMPEHTFLGSPRPNPGNLWTMLEFGVGTDQGGRYEASIYDVRGRRVAEILSGDVWPGVYRLQWNGRDRSGRRMAAGIYFVRVTGPGFCDSKKIILLR